MGDSEPISSSKSTQIVQYKDEQSNIFSPVLSLFSNFLQLFNFPPPKHTASKHKSVSETVPATSVDDDDKPVVGVVKFPKSEPEVSPVTLESDDNERDTHPLVLWQVYAIGGFFVLKWAWARWNERKEKKKPSNDDPSAADT